MTAFALVGLVLVLLFLRQPLLIILLSITGFIHLVWGRGQLDYIIEDMWVSLDKELILSIPMFVLCGGVMTKGSTSRRLIAIASALTRPLPGGMAVACVISCGVFAAISGSSIVTMLAIGSIMYPAMVSRGYSKSFALGAVASAGTLGIIIPPSIPLILYGVMTATSISDLFLAGIGPGLLLLGLFADLAVIKPASDVLVETAARLRSPLLPILQLYQTTLIFRAERQRDYHWVGAEAINHHVNATVEIRTRTVHFVYKADTRHVVFVSLAPYGFGLWFNAVNGGVYGGIWDADGRASSVIGTKASTVRVANVTVRNAKKNGIVGYARTQLTLADVTSTGNANDGVHVAEASRLTASNVRAVKNRRNGLQLSSGASGTITDSALDNNGLAVTGSTTGKVGHGLGVASARATVTNTSMSSNKVCGASLTGSVEITLARSTLSGNGRHGVGTTAGVKATISDSVVRNNRYNGVLASGSGTHVRLASVTISGTSRHGLSVPSKGSATLQGSTITTSGRSNISVSRVCDSSLNPRDAGKQMHLALPS